jgi:outer membrane protein TolC
MADAIFLPLAERQQVRAAAAARAGTFNDAWLQASLAYLDLAEAQGRLAIAREALANAAELPRVVQSRVQAGTAPPADGLGAEAEVAKRRRQELQAEEEVRTASAELARLLRLDPTVVLFALEDPPVPVQPVDAEAPLPDLLAQGIASRPELAAHRALLAATLQRLRQQQWRPWLPTAVAGVSTGGVGGGRGSNYGNFSDRTDFDALLVWELRNLGFGERASTRERVSEHRQAHLAALQVRDAIAAESAFLLSGSLARGADRGGPAAGAGSGGSRSAQL